jgi:tRNA(fMet)-specific endonuclease VapC
MTSLSFLIDTDWVIDRFNALARVTRRLKELEPRGLGLSVISAAELWEGVYFSRDPKRSQVMLEEFLSGVVILGLDEEICKRFGQLRGSLRKRG